MSRPNEFPINLPTVQQSNIVFDEFAKIRKDRLLLPNQHLYDYYTLITKQAAVVILAADFEGNWVLNEEYRHPTGKILLCCPGGFLNDDESPLEGAKRELLEETGYLAQNYTLIGNAYPFPGISSQNTLYVYAQNAEKVREPQLDEAEILRTVIKGPQQLLEDIRLGFPLDGTLFTALGFYGIFKDG